MKSLLTLCIFCFPFLSFAQSFDSPESVEYDVVNARWLVGNHGSGKVLVYSPASGTLTDFCSGMTTGPYGIEILGNVLYCCDGGRVRGYDLNDYVEVFNMDLGASFLNGITSDGWKHLFVTDFTSKKVYRINVWSNSFNVMASLAVTPNGIITDPFNQRLVFVTWGANASVKAVSLLDSTVTTLATTSLSNFDGIVRDQPGNWYISSWGTNSLYKFNQDFSAGPDLVMTGLSQPADLGINANGDSIAIPNSNGGTNNVSFFTDLYSCSTFLVESITTHDSCNAFTGSAEVIASGGIPPYSYNWTNGDTTSQIFGSSGFYDVFVTDSVGCTVLQEPTIPSPLYLLSLSTTPSTVDPPNCNGTLFLGIANGAQPVSFEWTSGLVTGNSVAFLCPGDYTITLTDADGCSIDTIFTIDEENAIESIPSLQASIYPNPTTDIINIVFESNLNRATLTLFDITGRILRQQVLNSNNALVDVTMLANGSYTLVITNDELLALRQKIIVAR